MKDPDLICCYVPVPSRELGLMLARRSVQEHLAACGNVLGPMTSVYEWKGEVCEEEEWVLILKTTEGKRKALKELLEREHPYECPCLADWPMVANPEFAAWVQDQTQ